MDKLSVFWDYLSEPHHEDDFVDRLYFRYTPRILVIFATIIVAKEYGGNPIQCWAKAEFIGAYAEYANDYCFVEGTYYIDINKEVDWNEGYKSVDYYPWLAFMLAFQAVIFYLPYYCWSAFNHTSGLAVRALISMANSAAFDESGLENTKRKKIADHIYNSLNVLRTDPKTTSIMSFGVKNYIGKYRLTAMYLCLKVTFLIIAIVQLKFISEFLGKNSSILDFYSSIDALWNGKTWKETGNFPRVGFCRFEIRELEDNILPYTLQCVLMANMINEKIFVSVWWCLWFIITIGMLNLGQWLINLFFPGRSFNFIHRAIFNGNNANITRIHEEKKEKDKEFEKKTGEAQKLLQCINEQLVKSNLPLKSFSEKKIKLDLKRIEALQRVEGTFKAYSCDRVVYEQFMDHIGLDTVVLFRLMEINSSSAIVNELISQLFYKYVLEHMKDKKFASSVVEESDETELEPEQLSVTSQSEKFMPPSNYQQ